MSILLWLAMLILAIGAVGAAAFTLGSALFIVCLAIYALATKFRNLKIRKLYLRAWAQLYDEEMKLFYDVEDASRADYVDLVIAQADPDLRISPIDVYARMLENGNLTKDEEHKIMKSMENEDIEPPTPDLWNPMSSGAASELSILDEPERE